MRRILARVLFVAVMAVIAAGLGTATALVVSRPGKDLLARLLSEESNRLVRGSVRIAKIDGDFLSHLTLDSVVIRDTTGALLAQIPRLAVHFKARTLWARDFVFDSVRATGPEVEITKHRGGRMNYQEVLRLGEGKGGGGRSPLIRVDNLAVEGGRVTIRTPWNPDGRLTRPAQRDSALRAERAKPGRRIEPSPMVADGLQLVRVIDDLTLAMPMVLLSSPDKTPFTATIDTLAARISDPGMTVRTVVARVVQGADSLLFDLKRAALPNTVVSGSGRIDWPKDTVLYRFEMTAPRIDLADLRWISPQFPAYTGAGRVRATSLAGSRTEYDLRDLRLGDRASRLNGNLVAILDVYRGLGVRNLDLALDRIDLEVVRPYLDTLPFGGRLTGTLRATGFFDAMNVDADWVFQDALVAGTPENRLTFAGDVVLGGTEGLTFRQTRIARSDLALATIRRLAPAVLLDGRLGLAGVLDGPWRNVVFDGRATHRNGALPPSAITGRTRLDTRGAVLALDTDLKVDTLEFDGIRPNFPATPMQGRVSGSLKMTGDLNRMRLDGDLRGAIGRYRFGGVARLTPPQWAADSLQMAFERADVNALGGRGPSTDLNGRLLLSGRLDSVAAPETSVSLALGRGRLREFFFDSGQVKLRIRDSMLTVDTASMRWQGGGATASGALGWNASKDGTLEVEAIALSLAPFDSLVATLLGTAGARSQLTEEELLSGRGRASATVSGSLDRWRLTGRARADSTVWADTRVRVGMAAIEATGGRLMPLSFSFGAEVDSLSKGRLAFAGLAGTAKGEVGDLRWSFEGRGAGRPDLLAAVRDTTMVRVAAAGRWLGAAPAPRVLEVDSLRLELVDRVWTLTRPALLRIDSVTTVDTVVVMTDDGSSAIRLEGELPGRAPGRLTVSALGIALRDLYALVQRDTAGIGGSVALDGRIGGTLAAPTFRGSASVTGPVVGDVKAPTVRAVFNYQDKRLQSNLTFWRTGRPVLDVDAELPIDLAITGANRRQVPGALTIRGRADSVELAVVEALTPNLRQVVGTFAVDAQVGGSWEEPRLGGWVALRDGGAFVPGLGVTYGPVNGRIRLEGDSLVADSIRVASGSGGATITGAVRLERLTHPLLDLTLNARDFPLIDVRDYLTVRSYGEVKLAGPIERPTLTGQALAANSVIYFADLLAKDIVNLEDPLNVDLVDTTALRAQRLRAQFQSRFLDSLTIRDLRFRVGQDVWLRSNEANVALEGQVVVNKERRRARRSEYRVSGEFTTQRGSYILKLGPVFRNFAVEQGTVRYFNTPDLNADLDLSARYVVQKASDEDYPVIARITGTLLAPKLGLKSEPGREPLSERDLVSLLVTGTNSTSILAGGFAGSDLGNLASVASNVLSAELQRALISDVGLNVDLVEIRPGFLQGNSFLATGGRVTSLAVGRQLSNKLFAKFNLGSCLRQGDYLNARYFGASLEYRLHRSLKLQVAAEPVQSCLTQAASTLITASRYQFGADLKWDREY